MPLNHLEENLLNSFSDKNKAKNAVHSVVNAIEKYKKFCKENPSLISQRKRPPNLNAMVDPYGDDGKLPALHQAADRGWADIVTILINANADVNFRDYNRNTPLMHALKSYHSEIFKIEIIKILIDAHADVNKKGEKGSTPLTIALNRSDNMAIIKVLLEARADINKKGEEGYTPLMIAAKHGSLTQIEFLLKAGARKDIKTGLFGKTAIQIAAHYERDYCLLALKETQEDFHNIKKTSRYHLFSSSKSESIVSVSETKPFIYN